MCAGLISLGPTFKKGCTTRTSSKKILLENQRKIAKKNCPISTLSQRSTFQCFLMALYGNLNNFRIG